MYDDDNTFESVHCPGMVVGIAGSLCSNSVLAELSTRDAADNSQSWILPEDKVMVNTKCSSKGMDRASGGRIIIYSIHGGTNQQWELVPAATTSTLAPSKKPTVAPVTQSPITSKPSESPSASPTTLSPSNNPTSRPSASPSALPTTLAPSSKNPTASPVTDPPSNAPSQSPITSKPSSSPSASPTTLGPSTKPSQSPSSSPSISPNVSPSKSPSSMPSQSPSTSSPTISPTSSPTDRLSLGEPCSRGSECASDYCAGREETVCMPAPTC